MIIVSAFHCITKCVPHISLIHVIHTQLPTYFTIYAFSHYVKCYSLYKFVEVWSPDSCDRMNDKEIFHLVLFTYSIFLFLYSHKILYSQYLEMSKLVLNISKSPPRHFFADLTFIIIFSKCHIY